MNAYLTIGVILASSTLALAQPQKPPRIDAPIRATQPAGVQALELSGSAKLRPQGTDAAFNASSATVVFDDETVGVKATARFASVEDRAAFASRFPVMVLQARAGSGAWADVHTFYDSTNVSPQPQTPERVQTPVERHKLPRPVEREVERDLPGKPGEKPAPKPRLPKDPPKTVVPGLTFDHAAVKLAIGTTEIRAAARRADGTGVESAPLRVTVRAAPPILTILAMGGTCTDPDANTNHKTLEEGGITRDKDACAAKGISSAYLGDLTPMASVNCNNPCGDCTNFFGHLALRIMNTQGVATEFESINNAGTALCDRRTKAGGVRNRIVFGKWRNTEQELVCGTTLTFNRMLDDYVAAGGRSVILIGQSQGGAKLAGMIRDHWRWGNNLTVELLALWDATSFDVPNGFDTGHFGIVSMGVRRVGNKPKKVLNFCQYSNPVPFQNGAPLDPTESHGELEEHDLDGCFSHNGIARSQFVHQRTAEVVKDAVRAARDRARQ